MDPSTSERDIWALGCVIYEMLTGTPAFAGENLSDTIASVLRSEPDWRALPAETPVPDPCPAQTLPAEGFAATPPRRGRRAHRNRRSRRRRDTCRGFATSHPRSSCDMGGCWLSSRVWRLPVRVVGWHSAFACDAGTPTSQPDLANQTSAFGHLNANRELAISPDGRKIVYVANVAGKRQLFLRALGDAEGKPIDGTDGATTAFFSPDSEWIAFDKGSALQKTAVSGGSPITICNLSGTGFFGGDWGADNTIVFVPDYNGGLWTVSANGGTPQPLLKTDVEKDRVSLQRSAVSSRWQERAVHAGIRPCRHRRRSGRGRSSIRAPKIPGS